MFKSLLAALSAPDPDPLNTEDCELALAALLVRLARADETYSEAERERIHRVLIGRGLDAKAALELRHAAEDLEAQAPDTVRFTRALKDKVPYGDRSAILEALWEVALADGARDADEDALIRLTSKLLGITDVDSALARQRVEKRHDTGSAPQRPIA
ncbi:TerB family tellurite resistance protein [Thioclava litoralis]|uniref:TerB family tellurite resistance protein n=1 Tax=Thioclava litoralis TaxID=3076557 RepID=A0ABZ1DY47_9RHOB|nr:TerB family tellurite resistance protein [Thioclava sp. FTW29]